jgi:ribonuclease BN (tRNA processing enzyme)
VTCPDVPIGVFDSGVGGLTVARAITDQLPHEWLHYVGDTIPGPYGSLPIAQIRSHALAVADELMESGVKLMVIACNSVSRAGRADARERYSLSVAELVRRTGGETRVLARTHYPLLTGYCRRWRPPHWLENEMLLTVLGCSGSVPAPESPASGYLISAGDTNVILDLGNGTFGALQRYLDPFDLDGLILSHLHPDHCADVSALTIYRRYHPHSPPCDALPLYGPRDTAERLVAAYAPNAGERNLSDLSDVYEFRSYDGTAQIGPFEVQAAPVEHPCEAYALRVGHAGRSLVYSGDTGPCPQLVELATGADVLLAEASWPDRPGNPPGIHLSGRNAGDAAAAAGVGRLLITHVPPWTDAEQVLAEAKAAFDGPTELVRAGGHYEI